MTNPIDRFKRILELSKYDPEKLDLTAAIVKEKALKPLGKAEGAFMEDMTEAEFTDMVREQDQGWQAFTKRVKEVLHVKTEHDLT